MEKVLQHLLMIVTLWLCSVPCEQVARSCGRERFHLGLERGMQLSGRVSITHVVSQR